MPLSKFLAIIQNAFPECETMQWSLCENTDYIDFDLDSRVLSMNVKVGENNFLDISIAIKSEGKVTTCWYRSLGRQVNSILEGNCVRIFKTHINIREQIYDETAEEALRFVCKKVLRLINDTERVMDENQALRNMFNLPFHITDQIINMSCGQVGDDISHGIDYSVKQSVARVARRLF